MTLIQRPVSWQLTPQEVLGTGPVMPVLVFHKVEDALPVAEALLEGGINVLEITLRTPAALAVIEQLAHRLPQAMVGAGTVLNTTHMRDSATAGARFLISPGLTPNLLGNAAKGALPLIPGVATISEILVGMEYGYSHFKFFPAEINGGVKALKAIAGPLPDIRFCPTGGIDHDNAMDYLRLHNVECIGGSWLATKDLIEHRQWKEITRRAKAIVELSGYDFE